MINATRYKPPRIERISLRDWLKGTVTANDDGRTPVNGLRSSVNQRISQDGPLTPRPSTVLYGQQPLGPVLGAVFEYVKTTTGSSENWEISMQAVKVNEKQTISIAGSPTGGTFTITFSGQTTAAIAYNAAASAVQTALEALSNVGTGNVQCSGGALPGASVAIEFIGTLAQTDVALCTTTNSLTGGTSPTITVAETIAGGLRGVPHIRKDGDSWLPCQGKVYDPTSKARYLQIDDKVLVMNRSDNLSYLDIPTSDSTRTIVPFTPLATPAAPTVTKTGLTGSTYTIYYRVTANSTVGETAGSVAGTIAVGAIRETWDATSNYVTVAWAPVPNARSYNLYMGVVSGEEFLIQAGINGTSFKDDGSFAQDTKRSTPLSDATGGPRAGDGAVINGQVLLVRDKDNPRYVRYGGTGTSVLDFSPFNGGGWVEIARGSKEFPVKVVPFRDGRGNSQITVLCRGTNGRGKRYLMSPNSTTIGNTVITFFDVVEDNGQDGTVSPDGVILYDDSIWYPSRDGFKTTGTKPQLQNILSTNRVSNTIQPDIASLNNEAMDDCVGIAVEGMLYWAVPSNSATNNEIWTLDLIHEGAWMKPWSIAAKWLWLYNDNSGITHFCVLTQDDKICEFTTASHTRDDDKAFMTSATSGLIKFSEDGMEWAKVIDVTFFLQRPQGNINLLVAGRTEDSPLLTVGTETFDAEENRTIAGWSEAGWGAWGWSNPEEVPANQSNQNRPIVIDVDEELQWLIWQLDSSGLGVDYSLSDVVVRFVRIGTKDLV